MSKSEAAEARARMKSVAGILHSKEKEDQDKIRKTGINNGHWLDRQTAQMVKGRGHNRRNGNDVGGET